MEIESDSECIHGLGPVQACTICNGRDKREAKKAESDWVAITARFDSSCRTCGGPIDEGEIVFYNPSISKVRHLNCWE